MKIMTPLPSPKVRSRVSSVVYRIYCTPAQQEEILVFSPMMVGEEAKSVEAFPHLQEHRHIPMVEKSSNVVDPGWVNSITLLFPPKELTVGLTNLLRCRELVLAEDFDYGGGILNLLLDSTGPTLESLTIQSSFDRGNYILLYLTDTSVSDHTEFHQAQQSRLKIVQSCAS